MTTSNPSPWYRIVSVWLGVFALCFVLASLFFAWEAWR